MIPLIKNDWKVISVSTGNLAEAEKLIDADLETHWDSRETTLPHKTIIDLGATYTLKGFTYLPMQNRWFHGVITHYAFYTSINGKQWIKSPVSGEISNIQNSPVLQRIDIPEIKARFIKFLTLKTMDVKQNSVTGAEFGVITY